MSINEDEQARAKKLEDFLIMADMAIKVGRKVGLSDEYLKIGFQNRLTGGQGAKEGPREPASIIALARERGQRIRNFADYQSFKNSLPPAAKEEGGAEFKPWTVDADGKPVKNPMPGWTKELERLVKFGTLFQRRLAQHLIPPAEIEAAKKGGVKTWNALRDKWGNPDLPIDEPGLGGAA